MNGADRAEKTIKLRLEAMAARICTGFEGAPALLDARPERRPQIIKPEGDMQMLSGLAEDLVRRQRVNARVEGDQIVVPIGRDDVLVSEDSEFDRIVLWAEVARGAEKEASAAAEIAILYNEQFAPDRAATLCVSPEANCVLLGRSMEPVDFDSGRLLSEARNFGAELAFARSFFQDALAKAQQERSEVSSALEAQAEGQIRL